MGESWQTSGGWVVWSTAPADLRIAWQKRFRGSRCSVILAPMASTKQRLGEQILADRGRFVSNGVSTPRLVVAGAEGARVTDVDGRVYLDFAGGIGCQNTGHRFGPVVEALHRQVDLYLHQCFMVGVYEPYVETCRLLA
jgi:4-aminobutyrate aminotransferase-like enzyme